MIGPDAEQKWFRATVEVKRKVIRLCADIRIVRVGWDDRRNIRMRVDWTWLLGPNVPITELDIAALVRQPGLLCRCRLM